MSVIAPGAMLGIVGGGQLGRMAAKAARAMGYRLAVLDPDPDCAARHVVDRLITASFDDEDATRQLAAECDVLTLEIERVSVAGLRAAEALVPVRPHAEVLFIIQDRGRQKEYLARHGFPVAPFGVADSAEALRAHILRLGACFVKSNTGGYDGRGQVEVQSADEADAAWVALGQQPCMAEAAVDLDIELSVMVARGPDGAALAYPPALNHQENRVLAWSVLPGPIDPHVAKTARQIALELAATLDLVGLLAVEFFLDRRGRLLVNELAPRPHNSYHASTLACETGQFEQLVRAVCGLPLGGVGVMRPVAIYNLLGDLWKGDSQPDWGRALAVPGSHLFLYGKRHARPGRKMGHLLAIGDDSTQAVNRVLAAAAALDGAPSGS